MSGLYYRVQLRMFFSFVLFTSVLVGLREGRVLKRNNRTTESMARDSGRPTAAADPREARPDRPRQRSLGVEALPPPRHRRPAKRRGPRSASGNAGAVKEER